MKHRRHRTLNLLIVDQDEIAMLVHRKAAEETGLFNSIRSATNGLRAFDHIVLAAEGNIPFPDVVLFDLDLPVLNGITLLKVLNKAEIKGKENIVFIVSSSSVTEEEKDLAISLGVSVFLKKPMSEDSLRRAIHSIYRYSGELQPAD